MGIFDEQIPERYEKNPFFAVMENYVMAAIGKLAPDQDKLLNEMICKTFGGKEWKESVRGIMTLPPDTDDNLRKMWKQAQEEAEAEQESLTPEEFAREVVDEMFADMGES